MKSMRKTSSARQTPPTSNTVPLTQRRLKTKPALALIGVLLLGNLFWFILWVWPSDKNQEDGEVVASIEGEKITRQEWLSEMESRYGKDTLQDLVNEAVMEKAAKKYDINVTDEEIDLEIALLRSAQDATDKANLADAQLRQKVRAQLILEKVLAKDILIEEEQTAAYYEENQSLYNIPTSYRTSMIVVSTKEEAESVAAELKSGSEFSVLARERSLDTASASLGGDIGYITEDQESVDKAVLKAVSRLKPEEISGPVKLSDGRYALLQQKEVLEGQSFSYEEVKDHISRELAMEQLSPTLAPEVFWKEFGVEWFYGQGQ